MPQMMPMSWILVPAGFLFIYMLVLSKMFFLSSFLWPVKSAKDLLIPSNPWMW